MLSAGLRQASARQASIGAGIPNSVGATTVNNVCGSSLMTAIMAARAVQLGKAKVIVTGGIENMSRAPYLLEKARQGYRLGHGELTDSLIKALHAMEARGVRRGLASLCIGGGEALAMIVERT